MPSAASHLESVRLPATIADIRPAGGALALVGGVALTGVALYSWWPAGIALGLFLGLATSVVLGTRMQAANRAAPRDDALAARLGIVEAPRAAAAVGAAAAAPAPAAEREPEREPASVQEQEQEQEQELQPLPDVLYFDEGDARTTVDEAADPADVDVDVDVAGLKHELGDVYPDFARAARLVVSTQYASAARLQKELHLPYSRARRLLTDLEEQHFVGPATGSLPRQVLMPKDRLPEVERLLAV